MVKEISDSLIFGREIPHCLQDSPDVYREFKDKIPANLGVKKSGIQIVGSGCIGYSVAPRKFPNVFHEESDIDVVIIDSDVFDGIWSSLRNWLYPRRNAKIIPSDELEWINKEKDAIYWGWLDIYTLIIPGIVKDSYQLKEMRDLRNKWFNLFQSLPNDFPDSNLYGRKISARLYRSEVHLSQYHANGLWQLKRELESSDMKNIRRIMEKGLGNGL